MIVVITWLEMSLIIWIFKESGLVNTTRILYLSLSGVRMPWSRVVDCVILAFALVFVLWWIVHSPCIWDEINARSGDLISLWFISWVLYSIFKEPVYQNLDALAPVQHALPLMVRAIIISVPRTHTINHTWGMCIIRATIAISRRYLYWVLDDSIAGHIKGVRIHRSVSIRSRNHSWRMGGPTELNFWFILSLSVIFFVDFIWVI